MNNLLEEDENEEEELPGDKVSTANDKNESKANGAHLSAEVFFDDQKNLNSNVGVGEPQNLIISGFKTETCI